MCSGSNSGSVTRCYKDSRCDFKFVLERPRERILGAGNLILTREQKLVG